MSSRTSRMEARAAVPGMAGAGEERWRDYKLGSRAVVVGGRQLEMPTGIYHRHVLHRVLAPSSLNYKQLCALLPA